MNSAIGVILLVSFIIVCILLVLLVLVQDDGQSGMGGLLGGRGTAAFGSHSANVLTKATVVLVVLFFVLALALALVNKRAKGVDDLAEGMGVESVVDSEESTESAENGDWWLSGEAQTEDGDSQPGESSFQGDEVADNGDGAAEGEISAGEVAE